MLFNPTDTKQNAGYRRCKAHIHSRGLTGGKEGTSTLTGKSCAQKGMIISWHAEHELLCRASPLEEQTTTQQQKHRRRGGLEEGSNAQQASSQPSPLRGDLQVMTHSLPRLYRPPLKQNMHPFLGLSEKSGQVRVEHFLQHLSSQYVSISTCVA